MSRCRLFAIIALILFGALKADAQQLEEAAQEIANQISLSLISEGKKNIAILPFTNLDNSVTRTGSAFSEELNSRLFRLRQGKYEIVERSKVAMIWKEQKDFSDQWLINNMKGFSEILGADAILVGTLFDWDGYQRVNARLLAVPSGQLFASASTRMKADTAETKSGSAGVTGSTDVPIAVHEGDGLRVELFGCAITGDELKCDFSATSTDGDRTTYLHRSRIIEKDGNEIGASGLEFGRSLSKGSQVAAALVRGIPIRGKLKYSGINTLLAGSGISLIELDFGLNDAQFRDVRPRQ